MRSGAELSRAVGRLDEVRVLTLGLPTIDHVPPGRVTALARFATVAKAQAVARMPLERRTATLLAFVRTLEATAQDDVLDLFDIVVTVLFTEAAKVGKKARLCTIRDLDAAALQLRSVGGVLMDDAVQDGAVRKTAFAIVPRAMLAAALQQIDAIVRPPGDLYFAELRAQTGKLRFLPAMLRSVAFGATPAGQPTLDAMRHLRSTDGRGPSPSAPLGFVPSGWKRQVRTPDGGVDSLGYRLCLLDSMRTGDPPPRPVCLAQPALRRPPDWSAGRSSMGGGTAVHLPHPWALDRRSRRGRPSGRAPGRRLSGHRGQPAQERGREGSQQELCVAVRHRRTDWHLYVGIPCLPWNSIRSSQPEASDGGRRQFASVSRSAAPCWWPGDSQDEWPILT